MVSVHAYTSDDESFPLVEHVSERIIVRVSPVFIVALPHVALHASIVRSLLPLAGLTASR